MDAWIIADSDQLASRIRETLSHLSIECSATRVARPNSCESWATLVADFDGLVFLGGQDCDSAYLDRLRQIREIVEDRATIVAVSSIRDHGTVLTAIRAGASDFLSTGETLHDELVSFVSRIRAEGKQNQCEGRVTSIVPCHSACDASLLAVNLATHIARRSGSCGLLDFQLRGGDLALLLKLTPRHTIVDLVNRQVDIDEAMFEQALVLHESGIRLLAGPESFIDLKNVRPQACQQIVSLARRLHTHVIINSEDVQHAEQVRALANSDDIVVTMRLDVPSLHRVKQHLEFMTRNHVQHERIHIVALGANRSGELPVASVKKVLRIQSLHTIPDDPVLVLRSVNTGRPLVLESPRAKISQAMVVLAEALTAGAGSVVASPARMSAVKAAAVVALNTLPFYK